MEPVVVLIGPARRLAERIRYACRTASGVVTVIKCPDRRCHALATAIWIVRVANYFCGQPSVGRRVAQQFVEVAVTVTLGA